MTANVGALDQLLRLAVGFVLLFLAGGGMIAVWGYIGVFPMATAAVSWCPMYRLLGVSTTRDSRRQPG